MTKKQDIERDVRTRELDAQLSATINAMRTGRARITEEIDKVIAKSEEQQEELRELLEQLHEVLVDLRHARSDVRHTIIDKIVAAIALDSIKIHRKRPPRPKKKRRRG